MIPQSVSVKSLSGHCPNATVGGSKSEPVAGGLSMSNFAAGASIIGWWNARDGPLTSGWVVTQKVGVILDISRREEVP